MKGVVKFQVWIPSELHRRIRLSAFLCGGSMSAVVLHQIGRDLPSLSELEARVEREAADVVLIP